MDEKIDIRKYPIPNWSSRKLSAMQNGKWMYFYNSTNNETLFNYKPYSKKTLSIVPQRSPGGLTNRSSALSITAKSNENNNVDHWTNYDSYQLFQNSKIKEEIQQQIFVTPTFSKPEKNLISLKSRNTNEDFVPSETNIINEIKPIIPVTPGLSIVKSQKEKLETVDPVINLNSNNDEKNENDEHIYFSMKRNDAKNHNAFHFYESKRKQLPRHEKTQGLIEDSITSKRTKQSISQLNRFKGSGHYAFNYPMARNQKHSHSSMSPNKT